MERKIEAISRSNPRLRSAIDVKTDSRDNQTILKTFLLHNAICELCSGRRRILCHTERDFVLPFVSLTSPETKNAQ
jgi:hypothetical protein